MREDRVMSMLSADMFSDAGEHMMGGAQFKEGLLVQGSAYKEYFGEKERGMSSTYRELRAIEQGLRLRGELFRGHVVRWGCDNWAASKIIKLGSMKFECHEVAKSIGKVAREFEVVLEPFWLSRRSEEITVCDALSKDFDMGDYRLSRQDFECLELRFGPFTTDFFASSFGWQFSPFYTKVDCGGAAGVDAFSVGWGAPERGFFHPPVGLIVKVVRYAEKCGACGLLVVPDWPGSVHGPLLREKEMEGRMVLVDRFRPRLESPEWMKSTMFSGIPKFDFLAYEFRF